VKDLLEMQSDISIKYSGQISACQAKNTESGFFIISSLDRVADFYH